MLKAILLTAILFAPAALTSETEIAPAPTAPSTTSPGASETVSPPPEVPTPSEEEEEEEDLWAGYQDPGVSRAEQGWQDNAFDDYYESTYVDY